MVFEQYNPDAMHELEPLLDKSVKQFIDVLQTRFAASGKICDLADFIHFCKLYLSRAARSSNVIDPSSVAFDAIMDIAFSNPVGFVKAGHDVQGIIGSLTQLFHVTRIMTTFPELQKFINRPSVSPILGTKTSDTSGPGMIRGVGSPHIFPGSHLVYT